MNSIFCLLLSINQAPLVSLFIVDVLMFVWFLEKKGVRKSRRRSGLPVNRFRKVFRIVIKAKYACYKEIFLKILSSFAEQAVQKIISWIDLFPKTYFLIYLFEWAEKPKWKCMAEDIYMRKLLKYFNGFPRTKSYFLTQFAQKK